jgi:hypothetical protein
MAVLLVLVAMALCVHGAQGLVCTKDFKEKGCNKTISDIFTSDMFEAMFNHRNDRVAHAQSFWTYDGFMAAATKYEKEGFASVGGEDVQKRELASFLAHVAHETSCKFLLPVPFFFTSSLFNPTEAVVGILFQQNSVTGLP